jgi:hypothetical protein
MRIPVKTFLASFLAVTLLLTPVALRAGTTTGMARLEGLVLGADGRRADGFRIHLIDAQGAVASSATSTVKGTYSFKEVTPGSYALGIESPEGWVAAVDAPPVRLGDGELARRDVRLVQSNAGAINQATGANYGLGMWWAGLSPAAKAWTIVGIIAVVGVTFAALDDDDDAEEDAASPFD